MSNKCTSRTGMICDHRCNHCGFSELEIERRKKFIKSKGLTEVDGVRKLIIPRPHSIDYYLLLNNRLS